MFRLFNRRPETRASLDVLERYAIAAETRARLADWIEQAQERELYHFNPRRLGEELALDQRATLKLLLGALYEGLMDLHWDVRCPMCGSLNHRGHDLANLHHNDACGVCQATFSTRFDEEVRVTFSPSLRLRPLGTEANDVVYRALIDERLGPVPGQALMLLSDFQRLFPQQRLLPDESLNVTRSAMLFTDLAGSTALYARRGDPRAYYLVRLHFDELFRVADESGGTMIKTIGDAVMAVFLTPIEAMRAAFTMQAAIENLNRRAGLSGEEELILKVGMHSGPCLSVTLNDRPDYFGTTVNIAARVQGLSRGNDIVFTEAVHNDDEVQALLGNRPSISERAMLKGIDEEVVVFRVEVSEEARTSTSAQL
ncbi:adenylate/guanylate cyclase domain-containing protein [Candidatus Gracilibacteria bacterium]|nr:adenylate/guanylate cyclase domain-containing protein [Candidatus Gracilibacteria bacterium]